MYEPPTRPVSVNGEDGKLVGGGLVGGGLLPGAGLLQTEVAGLSLVPSICTAWLITRHINYVRKNHSGFDITKSELNILIKFALFYLTRHLIDIGLFSRKDDHVDANIRLSLLCER
jgi:hypothetical protein